MPQNLKFAFRAMRRNPALTGVALASIAIGASAAAVVFAAVKAVLLQPFPYTNFAIRFAVGADRAAILRQLLVESCVLALAGGLAGFLLTAAAWRILPAIAPMSIPRLAAARADGPVFLFTVAISLVNGILFGILPAFRAA